MDRKEMEGFLVRSLDDARMSRGESRVFRELLEDGEVRPEDYQWLRSRVFDLAGERMVRQEDRDLLSWVLDSLKALERVYMGDRGQAVDEVLFFPDHASLDRLVELLDHTRRTMDVCVFTITHDRLSAAIERAMDRGVRVRIVTDDDKASDSGSDVVDLARRGAGVRFDSSPEIMHHKFAVLDGRILLNGSFNWTRTAATVNQENLVVTTNPHLVRRFSQHFERLWQAYAPGRRG